MSNADFAAQCAMDNYYAKKRRLQQRYNELFNKPVLTPQEQRELIKLSRELEESDEFDSTLL